MAKRRDANFPEWMPLITDAAIAHAQDVLAPAQTAVLRQLQAQQLNEIKLAPALLDRPTQEIAKAGG